MSFKIQDLMREHQNAIDACEAICAALAPASAALIAESIAFNIPRIDAGHGAERFVPPKQVATDALFVAIRKAIPLLAADVVAEARAEVERTRGLLIEALAVEHDMQSKFSVPARNFPATGETQTNERQ